MKLSRWFSLIPVLVAAVFACSTVVRAQGQEHGQKAKGGEHWNVEDTLKQWTSQLNLTDEQKEKIKPILTEQAQKLRDLRNDTSLSREDRMAKAKDIHQDTDAKIKAVLNPEQAKKFDEMREQARAAMKERHKGGPPPEN